MLHVLIDQVDAVLLRLKHRLVVEEGHGLEVKREKMDVKSELLIFKGKS